MHKEECLRSEGGFLIKLESFWWHLIILFVFLRPFLCEQAFPVSGFWFLSAMSLACAFFIFLHRRSLFFPSALNYFVLLFVLSMAISLVFTRKPAFSLFQIAVYLPNILLFYAISSQPEERKKQIISFLLVTAAIASIYALYQYFVSFRRIEEYLLKHAAYMSITDYMDTLSKRRAFSVFCSPNIFATYLLMVIFIASGSLLSAFKKKLARKDIWRDASILLLMILCLGALLLTRSLGGVFALFVTFIFYLLFKVYYFPAKLKKGWPVFKNIIFMVLFIVLIFATLAFNDARISQVLDLEHPSNSFIQRLYYWQASLKIIKDYFLTGVGWRLFGYYYEIYRPELANTTHYSHNVFLQVSAELGIIGLLAFLGIVAFIVHAGLDKERAKRHGMSLGLILAAVVFLVHNSIDISFYFGQTAFLWWTVLAILNNKAD